MGENVFQAIILFYLFSTYMDGSTVRRGCKSIDIFNLSDKLRAYITCFKKQTKPMI